MENGMLDEITKTLTEFALTKFPVKALEVKGPVREGSSYRWRIVSTRYKDVTVLLRVKKPLFQKPSPQAIEVYGSTEKRVLKPTLHDFFEKAELVPV
jgi:hypothetical protein